MSAAEAAFLSAVVTAVLGFVGVLVANHGQSKRLTMEWQKNAEMADQRMASEMEKDRAVREKDQEIIFNRLDELTREVREHNNFARRVPVMEEQIKVANHRIEDLERKTGA